jgi:hypothetical protein
MSLYGPYTPITLSGKTQADVRQWVNPDGSEGGIVAISAKIDDSVTVHEGASVGEGEIK